MPCWGSMRMRPSAASSVKAPMKPSAACKADRPLSSPSPAHPTMSLINPGCLCASLDNMQVHLETRKYPQSHTRAHTQAYRVS